MKYISLLLAAFAIISCNSQQQQKNTLFTAKLDKVFEPIIDASGPGGSILIKKGDQIKYLKSFGLADLGSKEKITEHTAFNTGSISKTFVSNGILILKERGLLSLEDSISMYFDDFKHPEISNKVRIKHLLSHTSGLPDNRKVDKDIEFYLTAKDTGNFAALKLADSLNFLPGEKYEYSNPAYNGLALIIEKITKNKWQNFIVDHILTPSSMPNTKITDGAYPQKDVAHAYEFIDNQYVERDYGEIPTFAASGNSGIWSSVMDLAKYEQALQQYTFLSKKIITKSRTIYTPKTWKDTINPFVGYSWFIRPELESKYNMKMVYHTGSSGGFRSFYLYFPSKDILFIGLFNKPIKKMGSFINNSLDICKEYNWFEN